MQIKHIVLGLLQPKSLKVIEWEMQKYIHIC